METNCASRGTESVNTKVLASTLHAEPAEQPIGRTPIGFDLFPERVDIRKLTFIPDALHESEPHRSAVQIAGIPEQVGIDRQVLFTKGRSHADVRDACVYETIDRCRRRIDAVRWNQFVIGLEIGRGKPNLPAAPPACDDRALDEVRVP